MESESSIINPICYSGKVVKVTPGQLITIAGKVKNDAEQFQISFGSGKDESSNIQFDMKVKFGDDPMILRNCYTTINGWERNEIEENLLSNDGVKNPIRTGNDFKLAFLTDEEKFLITIDGKTFCTFRYRHPLSDIKRITVQGDVEEVFQVEHQMVTRTSEKPGDGEFIGSIPMVKNGTVIVLHGVFKGINGSEFCLKLTDSDNSENVMIMYWNHEEHAWYLRWRINGNLSLCGPTRLEGDENFEYDLETLYKVAIGVTKKNFYITTNGKHFISDSHDGSFLDKPLCYQISAESLTIDEVNIHHLDELDDLREEENNKANNAKIVDNSLLYNEAFSYIQK